MRFALPSLLVLSVLLATLPVYAQPGPALSFHLAAHGEEAVEGLSDECGRSFADPLNQSGRLVQRASSEVAAVVSECTAEIGSAAFSRDCELAMATSTVDFIVLVEADQDGEEWYFRTSVLSPLRAATVWSDDVFVSGTRRRATADGCEELGNRFLSHLDIETRTPSRPMANDERDEPSHGVLEVLETTPALVEVWVDGTNTGMSGGQLIVPAGEADVELRATGYQTYRQPVTVVAGDVLTLRGISLDVLPAELVITSNVVGATALIDGQTMGTTPIGSDLELSVPPGARVLRVERDGYEPFELRLDGLTPGQRRTVEVELVAAFVEAAEPEPVPRPDTPPVEPSTTPVEPPRGGTTLASWNGRLSRGDDTLSSGEFRDVYTFQGTQGEAVEIVMRSEDFNTYLMVRGPNGYSVDNEDGTGTGANARMVVQWPESGEYTISATSSRPGESGDYVVEVTEAAPGETEVWGILPLVGTLSLEAGDLTLRSGEYYDTFAFYCGTGTSHDAMCAVGSTIDVAMVSREFDTYVYVRGPNDFAVDNNDLRGTDAGLSFRVPDAGIYRVYMTSNRVGETGTYAVEAAISTSTKR